MSNFPTQSYYLSSSAPQGLMEEMPAVDEFRVTKHAVERMDARRIPYYAVQVVLAYGRFSWVRGGQIFTITRRQVNRASLQGHDLAPFQGIQVVCSPNGSILTVYKNQTLNFRKSKYKNNSTSPALAEN